MTCKAAQANGVTCADIYQIGNVRRVDILRLPQHRPVDAVPAARVIVEQEFLELPRLHLAVLRNGHRSLRKAVGRARGVEGCPEVAIGVVGWRPVPNAIPGSSARTTSSGCRR